MEQQSSKRFRRKGFKFHIVNPANFRLKLPMFDPKETNHERVLRQKKERKQRLGHTY